MIMKNLHCCVVLVTLSDVEVQEHYDDFFEEVFTELEDKVSGNGDFL